jgi:hypothetical protein
MVQIKSFKKYLKNDGSEFIALQLEGGVELVQSQQTGKFYATVRKCNMPCTFDQQTAEQLIGQTIAGTIVRVPAEPYDYTIPSTGEVIQLAHSYQYQPEDSSSVIRKGEPELV